LQQLSGLAHNLIVTDSNLHLPATLSGAEEKFRTFLASQNYPKVISWTMPGDVVVDAKRNYWVRTRSAKNAGHAALRYTQGLERRFGIMLKAVCATETVTFAFVFVPIDEADAQRHFMGRGLKFSCPVERYTTSAVTNPLKWKVLSWRNGQRSKLLEL
jgi:hypothetical protein